MAIDKRTVGAIQAVTGLLGLRGGFAVEAVTADTVLTRQSSQVLRLTPDAAHNVDLPEGVDGLWFAIANVGAGVADLTVRKPGGGATVTTVTPTDVGIVAHTDGDWALVALVEGVVA